MSRRRQTKKKVSGFTRPEIDQMEKLLQEAENQPLTRSFYEKVTKKLTSLSGRRDNSALTLQQVQDWFQDKRCDSPNNVSSVPNIQKAEPRKQTNVDTTVESTGVTIKGDNVSELCAAEFEARSSKDGAWYDVAEFLTHRVTNKGATEVRVRFVGFGAEEDEWVNVEKAVRKQSIPVEPSDCSNVVVGDLVLCFRERREDATYFDAHVLEIKRRLHDIRGCRCIFLVRYDHDRAEERVPLRRICSRPRSGKPPSGEPAQG